MSKAAPDAMLDAGLDYVANSTIMHLCSAQPADYAGIAAVSLADVVVDGTDFTKADHATSGRQVTVGEQTGVTIDASGDATHVVLASTGDTTLRYVTTCATQTVTSGNTATIGSFIVQIADPT